MPFLLCCRPCLHLPPFSLLIPPCAELPFCSLFACYAVKLHAMQRAIMIMLNQASCGLPGSKCLDAILMQTARWSERSSIRFVFPFRHCPIVFQAFIPPVSRSWFFFCRLQTIFFSEVSLRPKGKSQCILIHSQHTFMRSEK